MSQLIGQIEWAAAPRLWVLVALPLVLLAAWLGAPRLSRQRRVAAAMVRAMAIACIVFAWAGPAWRGPTDRTWLVLAEDRSASVAAGTTTNSPQSEPIPGSQTPATISRLEFAGGTQGPSEKNTAADSKSLNGLVSDPALAVRRAAAMVPADYVPAIQLATDGRATRDGLFAAATADGAPLDTVSMPAFPSPEVCAAEVRAPLVARPGDTFDVDVIVTANHDDQGQLEFQASSDPPQMRPVQLHAGSNSFTFRASLGNTQADLPLRATISGCRDTHFENNTRRSIVSAGARPRVLLVGKPPNVSWPLLTAVQGSGFDAQAVPVAELPASQQGYESIDLVILSGIAPGQPTRQQQQALQQFVREQGGGLIVLGEGRTFDPAPLAGSWLEELLPVTALQARTDPPPRMALVLVIDKSQSMLDDHKLDLAKEAARRTVGLSALTPRDEVGVLSFSDDSRWISPLAPCGDKKRLLAAIDTLQADGATNMAPAMERARLALIGADVDRRHLILLTDGVSTPGDFSRLAAKMAAAGITVSTVAVGREADPTLLKDISRAAGGRHYQCDDPNDVPKMLVAEVQQAAGAQGRATFAPMVYQQLPGLSIAGAPRLGSFTPTSPKPQTELLLLAPGGDPLLAWGRQGRGIVVALTTSLETGA
ncbi:MAG: VWA domain-containing protein, partial [Planctomycetia bacterium]|nr:VWA domain-containing protein [Planctomycetia bacterium]